MIRHLFSSLRVRLLLLVLAVFLPVFGLALYGDYVTRELGIAEAQDDAMRVTDLAASEVERLLNAQANLLIAFSHLDVIAQHNAAQCNLLLADMVGSSESIGAVGVSDLDGTVWCSSTPLTSPVNIGDRQYFQRTLASRQLAISGYQTGRISRLPVINIALPMFNKANSLQGIITVSLNLNWLNRTMSTLKLGDHTEFLVLDIDQTILVYLPDSDKFLGQTLAIPIVNQALRDLPQGGLIETRIDDVEHLVVFVPLQGIAEKTGLVAIYTVPTATAYYAVAQTFNRNLIGLGLVLTLALIAAWWIGELAIVRRVRALTATTHQLAAGNLQARIDHVTGQDELADLSRQINVMADSLQARESERQTAERAFRRWADIFQNTSVGVMVLGQEHTKPTMMNTAFAAMHGYTIPELENLGLGALVDPAHQAETLAWMQSITQNNPDRIVAQAWHKRKDASVIPVLLDTTMVRDDTGKVLYRIVTAQDITALKNAETTLQRQAQEFATLTHLSREITSNPDLDATLNTIARAIGEISNADAVSVYTINSNDTLELGAGFGMSQEFFNALRAQKIPLGQGVSGRSVLEKQPSQIADVQTQPDYPYHSLLALENYRAVFAVPMLRQDQVVGGFTLFNRQPRAFAESEIAFYQAIAQQCANAVENSRLYHAERAQRELAEALASENARLLAETQQRADQFSALYETSHELAGQHDLNILLDAIVNNALKILRASTGDLYLYDSATAELYPLVGKGFTNPVGLRVKLGEGMAGRVAQSRQPLIIDDYHSWEHRLPQYETVPFRAILQVPLVYGGDLIGVLSLTELAPSTRKFTEADARLLTLFASQAAGALHNAHQFQEARARAEQLGLLYDAGLALNSVLEPRAQLEFLFKIALQALHADRAEFFRFDPSRKTIQLEMALGGSSELQETISKLDLTIDDERHLVPWVCRNRMPLYLPDVRSDLRWANLDPTVRTGLWVPVEHEDNLIGVFCVLSSHLNAFTLQDQRLLTLFANQAAVALENARLLEQAQSRATRMAILKSIADAVSQTPNLDQLLEMVFEQINSVMTSDALAIALCVPGTDLLDFRAQIDEGRRVAFERRPIGKGLRARVIDSKQSLLLRDVQNTPNLPPLALWGSMTPPRSWLGVPLKLHDQVVGIITIESYQPNAYSEEDEQLLNTIADQVAVAIQKIRLFEETQQRADQLAMLNNIARAISQSLDLDEILETVYRQVDTVFKPDAVCIALYDAAAQELDYYISVDEGIRAERERLPIALGFSSRLITTGKSLLIDDALAIEAPPPQSLWGTMKSARAWLGAPIQVGGAILGIINVQKYVPNFWNHADEQLLVTIADQVAAAIQKAQLYHQTEERMQRLNALHVIDTAISASLDIQVVMDILLAQVTNQLQVDAAQMLAHNPHDQSLSFILARGIRYDGQNRTRVRLGEGYAGRAVLEHQTVLIANLAQANGDPRIGKLAKDGWTSYLAIPVVSKAQTQGVLEIFHRAPLQPNQDWFDFLGILAGQAAIAIDSTTLFENLQRSNLDLALAYDATIEGWARALDMRVESMQGHADRLIDLTLRVARTLKMNEIDLVTLRRGVLLHDIGKMVVPDQILSKPDKLSETEWAIMRKHPQYARDLLAPIEFLRTVMDIPYNHHEKWDGTGYPRGLKGDQIPLAARIFAVVDVWDALRSARPYRAAWTGDQAREYILAQAGKHFDPEIVKLFFGVLDKG